MIHNTAVLGSRAGQGSEAVSQGHDVQESPNSKRPNENNVPDEVTKK